MVPLVPGLPAGAETTSLHRDFGVEVDLHTRDLTTIAAALRALVPVARVVRIRSLPIDESEQLRLAASLGDIVGRRDGRAGRIRPNVRYETGADRYADRWHADQSWATTDAWTMLSCVSVEERADQTAFIDTSAALRGLDPTVLASIDRSTVTHDVANSRRLRPASGSAPTRRSPVDRVAHRVMRAVGRSQAALGHRPEVVEPRQGTRRGTDHPLIDRCPSTGARHLRIGDHAWLIEGLTESESTQRLSDLHTAIDHPENVLGLQWQPDDLVVFDNRLVLHRRVISGERAGRVLRRTLVVAP